MGIRGMPAIPDRAIPTDHEDRALRQPCVPLPAVVSNPKCLGGGAFPITEKREVDPESAGECHLGKCGSHCDAHHLGAELSDLADLRPELGQLVTSYVPKVENVEEHHYRALRQQAVEAKRLLEGAPQHKSGGTDSDREGVT